MTLISEFLDSLERREIITVRGQSYVSRLPNIDPPPPSPPGEGDNILEYARHRIALLQ